ncbi:MAG: GIY-YIG nuclease family protein [Patescibacteria group bacterium]
MQYVYILKSDNDGELYVGCTKDLKIRLKLHNSKKVPATKKRGKLKLIYYEAFLNPKNAFVREQFLKTGWGRNSAKKMLAHYFLMAKS